MGKLVSELRPVAPAQPAGSPPLVPAFVNFVGIALTVALLLGAVWITLGAFRVGA